MAFSIRYIYQIVDKFSPALKRINATQKAFRSGVSKTRAGLGKLGKAMGSAQGIATSMAAAIGGKVALDKFVNFDTAMNKLESVTFASGDQMARMRDMAKDLGATTQFTAGQAAEGMTYLAMAGLDTEKVLKAIPGALQLAAAGGLDLGQAADIATNVLGQMNMSVEDLAHVNDVLALAQSKANFNIVELFEAMRPVGTTASNLGMSLEELTANLGAMANAGEKGSIAGTLFRNALTNIAGPSKEQKKLYKDLGINLSDFVEKSGKIKNFKGLVGELRKLDKQGRLTVPILQKLYGDRGFRAMQILAGKAGEGVGDLEKKLSGAAGAAEKAAKIQMKGLPGALKAMSSAFEAVVIAIFESGLDQVLIDVSEYIIKIARSISSANPKLLKISGIFFGLMTAIAPILTIFSLMLPAIAVITSALGGAFLLAFAGVGAAIYEIVKNWDYLVDDFKRGIQWIKDGIDEIKKGFGIVGEGFKGAGKEAMGWFQKLDEKLGLGSAENVNIAAKNTIASKGTLNGNITVEATKGTEVKGTRMKTDVPGNLGFNTMASVGM